MIEGRFTVLDWSKVYFNRNLLLASGMFDLKWYQLANPYVVRDRIDPVRHFLLNGRQHRISPSRAFHTERYLEQYEEARASRLNPLVHYLKSGRARGLVVHPAPPSEADRIVASGLFDEEWYLSEYSDVAKANYPALLHYMVHGAMEGRSPGPNFDSKWYLKRYPDVIGLNPLVHFIDHGRQEGRIPTQCRRALDIARKTLSGVEDLDPELYGTDYFADAERLDVRNGNRENRVGRCFEHIVEMCEKPPQFIVFLPWLVHGGADLVASHAVRAMAETYGPESVLVVLADHDREEAQHLLPEGVIRVSLSRIDPTLSQNDRMELVDVLIRGLQPTAVLNVNSQACWEAVRRRGHKLQHFTRLFAALFCPDFSPSDQRCSGYADIYLRHCLPFLTGIYFDNASYIEEVTRQFGIPDELRARLAVLRQPAPNSTKVARAARTAKETLRVLWASRVAPQKNIDLLIRIAETAPKMEFHIWGRGNHALEERLNELAAHRTNVHFHGPFERFDRLPLAEYDAFLYTSLWDGIPNVLLESAAAGLPIVASKVGGIGELVDQRTGWPVAATDDPEPYVQALSEIADDPNRAARRVATMHARLRENHDWKRYREILAREPRATGGLLHETGIDHRGAERASRGNAGKTVA